MTRRQALRMLGFGGLSLAGGATLAALRGTPAASYFLLTGDPDRDLSLLRRAAGLIATRTRVDLWPVRNATQDLTLVRNGSVLDPVAPGPDAGLRDLALQLRTRREPATMLMSVTGQPQTEDAMVVIARDGVVWDRLDGRRHYDRIEVPVAQGTAVLRLSDRHLTMVEAPCRHKLCQKMSAGGAGRIICAPNRLMATASFMAATDGLTG